MPTVVLYIAIISIDASVRTNCRAIAMMFIRLEWACMVIIRCK